MELTANDHVVKQFKELTPQNRGVVVQEKSKGNHMTKAELVTQHKAIDFEFS
jgi:hypothetical protein